MPTTGQKRKSVTDDESRKKFRLEIAGGNDVAQADGMFTARATNAPAAPGLKDSAPTGQLCTEELRTFPLSETTQQLTKVEPQQAPPDETGALSQQPELSAPHSMDVDPHVVTSSEAMDVDTSSPLASKAAPLPPAITRMADSDEPAQSDGQALTPANVPVTTTPPNPPPLPATSSATPIPVSTPRRTPRATVPTPVTPAAQILHSHEAAPTPARDILRAGAAMSDDNLSDIVPRPPTPPRLAERTPRNGYPVWSTPKIDDTPPPYRSPTNTLAINHIAFSPATRPPLLSIDNTSARTGPRRSLPGDDDPFFIRNPSVICKAGSIPAVRAAPPMIRITGPDDMEVEDEAWDQDEETSYNQEASSPEPLSHADQPDPMILASSPLTGESQASTSADSADGPACPTSPRPLPGLTLATPPDDPLPAPAPATLSASPPAAATPATATPTPVEEPPAPLPAADVPSRRLPPSGLPLRRPASRPTGLAAVNPATKAEPSNRKPSYPASLGSGPLRHQTARVVSNPVPPPSTLCEDMEVDPPSPRSVSEPTRACARTPPPSRPTSRMSLSMSTRHQDTTKNLAGLSEALARLRRPDQPRNIRRTSASIPVTVPDERSERNCSAPARLSNTNGPRMLGEKNQNTRGTLQEMMTTAQGTFLKGVVAFVDVYTAEGDEAGGLFVEVLKRFGARVLVKRPTEQCTHIIYKTGRPSTANFVRRLQPEQRPAVVGIKWVTRCAELREWVSEDEHLVNLDTEDVFQPKKKSMQPKNVGGGLGAGLGGSTSTAPLKMNKSVRNGAPTRPRLYAREWTLPQANGDDTDAAAKVSSPLKKTAYVHRDNENA